MPASAWSELSGLGVAPPRFFSSPHPDAVGSLFDTYGVEAARLLGVELYPWQAMVLERALEVDGEGRLCWSTVVVSVSRQSGKSVLVAGVGCGAGVVWAAGGGGAVCGAGGSGSAGGVEVDGA